MPKEVKIDLPRLELATMEITLVGDSPLITHQWSAKAKKQMLDKQMRRARQPKAAKSPEEDYEESLYRFPDGRFGFPAVAFKSAAVSACRYADTKMTEMRGAFHVIGELVPIEGEPSMREDMVRVGMGTADIRYRAQFENGRATLTLSFNTRAISAEQLVNLFNVAGFGVGVGEWRPERKGSNGRFHVATEQGEQQDDQDGVSVAPADGTADRPASGRRGAAKAPRRKGRG